MESPTESNAPSMAARAHQHRASTGTTEHTHTNTNPNEAPTNIRQLIRARAQNMIPSLEKSSSTDTVTNEENGKYGGLVSCTNDHEDHPKAFRVVVSRGFMIDQKQKNNLSAKNPVNPKNPKPLGGPKPLWPRGRRFLALWDPEAS